MQDTVEKREVSIDEKLASQLKAVSRGRILETASDALFRTMQDEVHHRGKVDSRLKRAHKLIRSVIDEWKGG